MRVPWAPAMTVLMRKKMSVAMDEVMEVINRYVPKDFAPKVGMILGSGLSSLAEQITNPVSIPYQAIPVCKRHGCRSCIIIGDGIS